ncbi:MAG: transcriptional repressor LexA [Elusimicrobia bacterium]|nr:transcriptional repressor LexA [Elusimicrobiota bacterium]
MTMTHEPTPKQKRILDFVVDCFQDHGFYPTLREIGRRFGVSVGTVQDQLQALEAKGCIKRQAGLARGFSLTGAVPGLQIPILGRVSAGTGVLAMDHIEAHYGFRDFALGTDFLLRVKGDSMEGDGILEGDLVQVRRQPTAVDGDVVVALVEEEGVVKRLRKTGRGYQLESANPRYPPITRAFQVIGLVIGLVRRYNNR